MSEIAYMPDGTPAPYVMSAEKAAQFLLIDGKDPEQTLRKYREKGLLAGTQVSRHVRYTLPDLMDFLKRQREEVPR
jgi:hypothetical protein